MSEYNYEANSAEFESQQKIIAGLNEINATAELFGMSFEDASEFCQESLTNQIKELQIRLRNIQEATPIK